MCDLQVFAKQKKVKKLKSCAAKKLQAALRPPDSPGSTLKGIIEEETPRLTPPASPSGSPIGRRGSHDEGSPHSPGSATSQMSPPSSPTTAHSKALW